MQISSVFSQMAPVLIMLAVGFLLRKKALVPADTIRGVKDIVFYITLPAVLFGAFYNVRYNYTVLMFFLTVFLCCGAALGVAFLIRGIFRIKYKMYPFLMTGFEAGMLGYALYGIAYGTDRLTNFATCDLGQTVFVYTVVMTTLYCQISGGLSGIRKAGRNLTVTPAFWGILAGIVVGVTGLGALLNASPVGPALAGTLKFAASPTGPLILLIVGYELEFSAVNIRGALATIGTRLAVMLPLSVLGWKLIHLLTGSTDRYLQAALLILFVLPAPFVIPLFTDKNDEKEYIATTLSINTLVTMVLFTGILFLFK